MGTISNLYSPELSRREKSRQSQDSKLGPTGLEAQILPAMQPPPNLTYKTVKCNSWALLTGLRKLHQVPLSEGS